MDQLIHALKAAGEPTRLRILLALDRSELTVTEICRILGQSQPRVSRHLKLLCEAGLLVRQAEGTSAYYRHSRLDFANGFLSALRPLADPDDASFVRDRQRLAQIRADRAELAARSFEKIAAEVEVTEPLSASADVVEQAMLSLVGDDPIPRLLDIGTGTGRILELFGPRIGSGLGIELSREMLNLARTRFEANRLENCTVRHGNAYGLEAGIGEINLVVLHHVLHFLDEPATAIDQAAQTVAANGKLLIVDFSSHHLEELRRLHGHRRLGFSDQEVAEWCEAAGLQTPKVAHLHPPQHPDADNGQLLTVTLWLATQRADAPTLYDLEVA